MKAAPSMLLLCIAMAFTAPQAWSQGRLQKLLDSSLEQPNRPEQRLNAEPVRVLAALAHAGLVAIVRQ
jgi:hypothetical protein